MKLPNDTHKLEEHIEYRVARSRKELEKAFALVYKEYRKREYTDDIPSRMRLSIHNALPQTTTFIGITEYNDIVATATIIPDSPLGLPMDDVYGEELQKLRDAGKGICEISMLASDSELVQGAPLSVLLKHQIFILSLFKVLLDYVRDMLKLDYICIPVNPRYSLFFEMILFKDLGGGLKSYPTVNGAPAIAKYLDVHTVAKEFSVPGNEGLYDIFVARQTDEARFAQKKELTSEDLSYFFLEKSKVFEKAPETQIEYIKDCYQRGCRG
jgi:hypothetical protein